MSELLTSEGLIVLLHSFNHPYTISSAASLSLREIQLGLGCALPCVFLPHVDLRNSSLSVSYFNLPYCSTLITRHDRADVHQRINDAETVEILALFLNFILKNLKKFMKLKNRLESL